MKVERLKVRFVNLEDSVAKLVHALNDTFEEVGDDPRMDDVIVLTVPSADLSHVRRIRATHPNMPLVLVVDGKTDFGDERVCTELVPAVVVRGPGGRTPYQCLMPAIYAAVPGSIKL